MSPIIDSVLCAAGLGGGIILRRQGMTKAGGIDDRDDSDCIKWPADICSHDMLISFAIGLYACQPNFSACP